METTQFRALLGELRDQLIDESRIIGRAGRRQRRRQLLGRLEAILGVGADSPSLEDLAAAIVALPPLARDVFTLHSRDGLDYPAIAAQLEISEEAVRRELAAALVALDQALHAQPGNNASPIA